MNNSDQPIVCDKRRILIVEDERQLADLFELSIRDWFANAEILRFANGDEAWKSLEQQEPALLVLDCSHPGMGGVEILERLAACNVRCPVLLTSELFEESVIRRLGKELKLTYLPKPFGIVQFWKMLNDLVGPSDFRERQTLVAG